MAGVPRTGAIFRDVTLRVVAGNPTSDEIKAVELAFKLLVAQLATRERGPVLPPEPGSWSDPDEALRRPSAGTAAGERYGWGSTTW